MMAELPVDPADIADTLELLADDAEEAGYPLRAERAKWMAKQIRDALHVAAKAKEERAAKTPEQIRHEEIRDKVLADYRAVAGKVLMVRDITAYIGNTCNQVDIFFNPPIAVRVDRGQDDEPESTLFHESDEWIDPYWNVTIADWSHPSIPEHGIRSAYMFGTSYNLKTGEVMHGLWEMAT